MTSAGPYLIDRNGWDTTATLEEVARGTDLIFVV